METKETKIETKPIILPNQCWKTLKDCLFKTAWATKSRDVVLVGNMELNNVIDIREEPPDKTPANDEWSEESKEIQLTYNQIECCKKALKEAVTKQMIYSNKWTGRLYTVFSID